MPPAGSRARCAAALAATLILAGCGWHLRGARSLPDAMATTHVKASLQTSELVRYIKRDLKAAGAEVVDYPAEEAAILSIRPRSGRRTLSVGPDGKAREYEVFYTVGFDVRKPGSEFEIPEQRVTLTRDFVYDPLAGLSAGREQNLLEESMERDVARLVIERLAAARGGDAPESSEPSEAPKKNAPTDETPSPD